MSEWPVVSLGETTTLRNGTRSKVEILSRKDFLVATAKYETRPSSSTIELDF